MGGRGGGGGRGGRKGGGGGGSPGIDMTNSINVQDYYEPIKKEYEARGIKVDIVKGVQVNDLGEPRRFGNVITLKGPNYASAKIYHNRIMADGKKYTDLLKGLEAFEKAAFGKAVK